MKKTKKLLALLVVTMLMLTSICTFVNAESGVKINSTPTKGSLKITKLENGRTDEEGHKLPLSGVKFVIYKVDDNESSNEIPEKYLQEDYDSESDENYYTAEATTNNDGQVIFNDLKLGRYLVVEAEAPANVVEKIANFLVDIPMTNAEGNNLIYDVEVVPKNDTVYGGFVLTKVNEKNEPLKGVTFILEKQKDGIWEYYEIYEIMDGAKVLKTLTTDENGQITLEGLPAGNYRFVETSTLDGYILDNKTVYPFQVSLGDDAKTIVSPENVTVTNEKPTIEKEITSITRNEKNTNVIKDGINSIDIGDTISYKVVSDIPSMIDRLDTYKISDEMSTGLTFLSEGFSVVAINRDADGENLELKAGTDYTLTSDEHSWVLEFTKENLVDYKRLEISYKAILNEDALATAEGNNSKVTLDYSNIVKVDYNGNSNTNEIKKDEAEVKVYTGGFNIEKRAMKVDGELLPGAVFKIATSENDARTGNYITDSEGNVITLTTDENGKASYKGLSYGTYYLVEVQAPTYEDNGETKHYNLLKDPVEITVGEDTFEGSASIIINKKGTILPSTGGMGALIFVAAGIAFVTIGVVYYQKNRKDEK